MPEPMPAGTYIAELEAENQAAVPVLRQLAHDPRFERAWALWQRYGTPNQWYWWRNRKRPTINRHDRRGRSEQWAARGLPNTQAAAMQFVSTEIPPQLAGRKWCVCACVRVRVCVAFWADDFNSSCAGSRHCQVLSGRRTILP